MTSAIIAAEIDFARREELILIVGAAGICVAFWAGMHIATRRFTKMLREHGIPFKDGRGSFESLKAEKLLDMLGLITAYLQLMGGSGDPVSRELHEELLRPESVDLRADAVAASRAASVAIILYMLGRLGGATLRDGEELWASIAADLADEASRW